MTSSLSSPTPAEKARQLVADMIDHATTDRFIGLESNVERMAAIMDQQSMVINELRDMVLVLSGQVTAVVGMRAVGGAGAAPKPKPKA